MKPPSKITVLGNKFDVYYYPDEEIFVNGQEVNGKVMFDSAVIGLRRHGLEHQTMFHEILHCADMATTDPEGERLTEGQVWRVGNSLFAILRDNPRLVKYLFEIGEK